MTADAGNASGNGPPRHPSAPGTATLTALLDARRIPGEYPAVIELQRDAATTTTRASLTDSIGRLAAGLQASGLNRGERVVLLAPNGTQWIVAALGVIFAGGVLVPLDTQMPREDLVHVLADCAPHMVLTTAGLRARLPADGSKASVYHLDGDDAAADSWLALFGEKPVTPVAAPDAPAAIFYTSGTTGPPKGVPLTHANLASNVEALCAQELADARDRVLVPLPFHHVYPFTLGILTALNLGAPVIVPFSLVGPQILRALQVGRPTVMLGVPRLAEALWSGLETRVTARGRIAAGLFHWLLQVSQFTRRIGLPAGRRLFAGLHRRLAPSLRLVVVGGAALDPGLGRRLQGLGWEVATGYGLTETSPILTYNPPDRLRLESAGMPLPGVELTIGEPRAEDGSGEVLARGPNVFAGYWNLPEKTAAAFTPEGWFRTGDRGRLDADGYLRLAGRGSAMIVLAGGENVDPERVEKAIAAAAEIREAGVLTDQGRLAAVVVPEPGAARGLSAAALRERIGEALSRTLADLPSHHRPGLLRVTPDPLPRTRLGKLRRHKLRELFQRLGDDDRATASDTGPLAPERMAPEDRQLLSDPAAAETWRYLCERFPEHRLTPDTRLAQDLGLDSLSWVDLTLALSDRAGIDLDDAAIARVETVRDLLGEAAGAAGTAGSGRPLAEELADPERLLSAEEAALLAAPGALRRALARLVAGLVRLGLRSFLRIEVRGSLPPGGPYLIAPRHLSALDPLVLLEALRGHSPASLRWAAWTGVLFSSRLRRWFSHQAGVLPIDPGAAPRSSLALAAACLRRGSSLVWFPEGQRSPDGALQPLRPGIGVLLRVQPVPVIPVWIEGTREALPPGRLLPRPARVRVRIGEPITPEEYGDDPGAIVDAVHAGLAALGDARPGEP